MGKIIEGVWDCKYCDTKKIRGSLRSCPNCGKPRDENTEFYIADPNNYVEDPSKINKNPDWICSFCNSLNSDSAAYCVSCGASRQDSEKNYLEKKKEREEKKAETEKLDAIALGNGSTPSGTTGQPSSGGKIRKLLPVFIFLILIAALIAYFVPKTKKVTVDSKIWQRNVVVEELKTIYESDWSRPAGAYNVSEKTELHSYRSVLDHYETKTRQASRSVQDGYDTITKRRDLGNGYFEEYEEKVPRYRTEYYTETYQEPVYRSEPVYRTKYYYYIDRWVFKRNAPTSGRDSEPYYASPKLGSNERLGEKSESYQVDVIEKNKTKTFDVSYDLWKQLEKGKEYKIKYRGSKILEIE